LRKRIRIPLQLYLVGHWILYFPPCIFSNLCIYYYTSFLVHTLLTFYGVAPWRRARIEPCAGGWGFCDSAPRRGWCLWFGVLLNLSECWYIQKLWGLALPELGFKMGTLSPSTMG
jgi:hypothetical protein